MKIVADGDIPFIRDYFSDASELILKPGRLIQRSDLLDVDMLLVRSLTRVNEDLLKNTAVKFVGSVAAGCDHLDTQWLTQQGIHWYAAAGYNAQAVADYVMAVFAALFPQSESFSSLRVAVVGVGQIGQRVAERLQFLGCQLLVCDPPRAAQEPDFISTPLQKLKDMDVISLHIPLTITGSNATYRLIDHTFLQRARKAQVLINTSRGDVIDFSALLPNKAAWRYCFDVWQQEPGIDLDILQAAWLATPHLAGHTQQSRYRGIDSVYRAAAQMGIIPFKKQSPPLFPQQTLSFNHRLMTWQEVVLAIFNPLTTTTAMKECLLKAPENCATLFDSLRKQYIGDAIKRHEFAYTTITEVRLAEKDRYLLTQLGVHIRE